MANFFQNLKAGAQDLVGGVTGQQTGEMIELEWVCEAPALGLRLRKSETPQFLCAERDEVNAAIVEHLTPGSPAEASGVIAPGDVLVRVGGAPAGPYDEAVAALASAPRPVTITVRRRVARAEGHSVLGSVNFRLEEEIAKAAHILRAMLAAGAAAPPAWVLAQARGFAFLRVVKLGIGLSARFGTGLVVARVGAAGGWSAPSAIGTVGLSMGPQAGAQLGEFLIVLNSDAAVSAFAGGGALSLGPQVGAVAGPVGGTREVTGAVGGERVAGDGPALAPPYFTYSIAKGLYVGASFEASAVNERNSVNERFYGLPGVRAADLLRGEVAPPAAADPLYAALAAVDQPGGAEPPPYRSAPEPSLPVATAVPAAEGAGAGADGGAVPQAEPSAEL